MAVLMRSAASPSSVWETPRPGASLSRRQVRSGSERLADTPQWSLCPSGSTGFPPRRTDPRLTAGEMDRFPDKGKEVKMWSQSNTQTLSYRELDALQILCVPCFYSKDGLVSSSPHRWLMYCKRQVSLKQQNSLKIMHKIRRRVLVKNIYPSFTWFIKGEFLHTGIWGFTVNVQNTNE